MLNKRDEATKAQRLSFSQLPRMIEIPQLSPRLHSGKHPGVMDVFWAAPPVTRCVEHEFSLSCRSMW